MKHQRTRCNADCTTHRAGALKLRPDLGPARMFLRTSAALIACILILPAISPASLRAQPKMPIAEWTFEPDPLPQEMRGREAGPFKPATGAGAMSGLHKSGDSKWSSPAGNGSKTSLSADTWSSGDFFVLKVSTANRRNIVLSWDQTRSDYAPPTFALSYRLPGESAKELVSYEVPVVRWSVSQPSENSSFVADLTGCEEIGDREEIEFLIMPKSQSKSPNGTTRIDNVRVWGVPHVAQESGP